MNPLCLQCMCCDLNGCNNWVFQGKSVRVETDNFFLRAQQPPKTEDALHLLNFREETINTTLEIRMKKEARSLER